MPFLGANRKELGKVEVAQDDFVGTCYLPLLDLLQEGEYSRRKSKNVECGVERDESIENLGNSRRFNFERRKQCERIDHEKLLVGESYTHH
jgi:hypothetical protein